METETCALIMRSWASKDIESTLFVQPGGCEQPLQ